MRIRRKRNAKGTPLTKEERASALGGTQGDTNDGNAADQGEMTDEVRVDDVHFIIAALTSSAVPPNAGIRSHRRRRCECRKVDRVEIYVDTCLLVHRRLVWSRKKGKSRSRDCWGRCLARADWKQRTLHVECWIGNGQRTVAQPE